MTREQRGAFPRGRLTRWLVCLPSVHGILHMPKCEPRNRRESLSWHTYQTRGKRRIKHRTVLCNRGVRVDRQETTAVWDRAGYNKARMVGWRCLHCLRSLIGWLPLISRLGELSNVKQGREGNAHPIASVKSGRISFVFFFPVQRTTNMRVGGSITLSRRKVSWHDLSKCTWESGHISSLSKITQTGFSAGSKRRTRGVDWDA